MAHSTLPESQNLAGHGQGGEAHGSDPFEQNVRRILRSLASLKITVTLFSLAIFLVVVGTLAQVDKDVWQVVETYFRCALAWVELKVFFPPSFFPGLSVPDQIALPGGSVIPLGFYFPGGWLIGGLLAVNLLAVFLVRFPVQARGLRLKAGWLVTAIGVALTGMVIAGGATTSGDLPGSNLPSDSVWRMCQAVLGLGVLGFAFAAWKRSGGRPRERAALLGAAALLGGALFWSLHRGPVPFLPEASLRILGQLFKGQVATLVLLLGCALLYKKRAGLVLLHTGIALMMFSEVLTGLTAVEGHMRLIEGETSNFVTHNTEIELAVIDHSGPDRDVVVAVPESRLLSGGRVTHGDLPFDIEVVHYLKNSVLRPVGPNESNPATAGAGLSILAEPSRPVSGTDSGRINLTAAYLTFLRKGTSEVIGTHLLGLELAFRGLADAVAVGDGVYDVMLRQRRTYKPYSIKLIDVAKEDYPGTSIPRHFASVVHLVDESRHVDRTAKIWMNNPLRFAGETLYQSGYGAEKGIEESTLSVVTNNGQMIPYVSCMIVATGLLAQFTVVLIRFLQRRSGAGSAAAPVRVRSAGERPSLQPQPAGRWSLVSRLAVPGVVLLCTAWLVGKARIPTTAPSAFALYEFGKLPVLDHGRPKPIDSLARTSLQILSEKQTFVDAEGTRQPAIRWLLDLIGRPDVAAKQKIFRIEHPDVLETLGLSSREGLRYALSEFADHLDGFDKQVELAVQLEPRDRSTYQKKILEFDRKLALWNLLLSSYQTPEELAKTRAWAGGSGRFGQEPPPLAIPVGPGSTGWQTFAQARQRFLATDRGDNSVGARATRTMAGVLDAYAQGDTASFNREVDQFRVAVKSSLADQNLNKVGYEAFFNHFEPCTSAAILYGAAFLFAALAWLGWSRNLNRVSFGLILAAFGLHFFVLVSRIYISGRPPVTNLYSSAVFIGWAAVLLGLGIELVFRIGIGNVLASVIGFATLLVAQFLGNDGDTFAVLQAVLDTQFWLATHVVCITLGYSATFVAGFLGVLYVLRGTLTPSLTPRIASDLSRMIYGTLCFAILFSFVGTVLGGLWADDSWGRFWGWDPKENGALIIVLWNVMVLHALRGGMVKQRGLAILAVAGNIAVSWSWFGVNELGIGLHSYGFTEGRLLALGWFVVSQLAIVALGLLPERLWISNRRHELPPTGGSNRAVARS